MLISPVLLAFMAAAMLVSAQSCSNYAPPNATTGAGCLCPPGFAGSDCSVPVCGGNLLDGYGSARQTAANISSCACDAGWDGPGCTICETSNACGVAYNASGYSPPTSPTSPLSAGQLANQTMICSKSPRVYSAGQMSCNVDNVLLQSLFPGSSKLTIARTLNPSLTPIPDVTSAGGNGSLFAQLWYNNVETFFCKANNCTQTLAATATGNSSTWTCPSLNCTCIPETTFCSGSTSLSSQIDTLGGQLVVACDATGEKCSFQQELLINLFGKDGLALSSCTFGECLSQNSLDIVTGNTTLASTTGNELSAGVIGGLGAVGGLLLLALLGILWGLIAQRRARHLPRTDEGRRGVGVEWVGVGYKIRRSGRAKGWFAQSDRSAAAQAGGGNAAEKGAVHLARKGDWKDILVGGSGRVEPGKFIAILGPSGAGKSSLIDLLAGRRKAGKTTGKVLFFSDKTAAESRHRGKAVKPRIGYVDQSDVHAPTSTVREALLFAARLRLPDNVPDVEKQARVDEVLVQLGLSDIADSRIGDGIRRGISGGEMRRVSIGLELVGKPDCLFLDEPTSGLDSVSANRVINVLRDLAHDQENPTAVIASIHQPSSRIYFAFDQVLLLSLGRQLYFGPAGIAPVKHFTSQGGPELPMGHNVADYLLEMASEGYNRLTPSSSTGTKRPAHDQLESSIQEDITHKSRSGPTVHNPLQSNAGFDDVPLISSAGIPLLDLGRPKPQAIYTSSSISKNGGTAHHRKNIGQQHGNGTEESLNGQNELEYNDDSFNSKDDTDSGQGGAASSPAAVSSNHRPSSRPQAAFLTQFEVLCGREWRTLQRDWTLFFAHFFVAAVAGAFAGGIYYNVNETISGFQNRIGSLFFVGSLIAFSSLSALYNLVEIRSLFLRERSSTYYSPSAWLLSRMVFDLAPLRLLPTVVLVTIVYWMVGLSPHAAEFFKFLLVFILYSLALTMLNFLIAVVIPKVGIAILFSSLYNLYLMLYAGFFVSLNNIPPVLRWLQYFDLLKYALEATAVNEVSSGLKIKDKISGIPVEVNAALIMNLLFGFGQHYYRDIIILAIFSIGYLALLVFAVWFFLREIR